MRIVVGIDEVGRGSWAGPLVAAAVLLNKPIKGLTDSKLLTRLQRENIATQIRQKAYFGIGWVSPFEIDRLGLTTAISLAMQQALAQIVQPFGEIIIDGNYKFLNNCNGPYKDHPCYKGGPCIIRTIVGADKLMAPVSAASILAKVVRDEYMRKQALSFPGYGFEKHVGYGTSLHRAALQKLGLCHIHRKTYKPIKAFMV